LTATLLALAVAVASPASALCLRNREIDSTNVPDGKTMIIKMRNGTVYHNTLLSRCSALKYNGFVWVSHNDEVCDNAATLRVLNSGQICQIGKFELQPPKAPAAPPAH